MTKKYIGTKIKFMEFNATVTDYDKDGNVYFTWTEGDSDCHIWTSYKDVGGKKDSPLLRPMPRSNKWHKDSWEFIHQMKGVSNYGKATELGMDFADNYNKALKAVGL